MEDKDLLDEFLGGLCPTNSVVIVLYLVMYQELEVMEEKKHLHLK